MSTQVTAIIEQGDQLFNKRGSLLSLWQEIADNFYPERADFTQARSLGTEMAGNLTTSYPIIARRDLGNAFGAMLRPSAKEWFHIRTNRPDKEDTLARQWLEWCTTLMKRAMYDRRSQFIRATKEGDHDFSAFGQCAISTEMNGEGNGFLYRCWHLRDVAWTEDEQGAISTVHRKWKPMVTDLCRLFPKGVSNKVREKLDKKPWDEINVRHIIMPSEQYARLPGGKKFRTPFVSIYIDVDNKHEMECVGSWIQPYTIPRWQTVSGSQYANSPAVVAALPDARLLQAINLTLLEAGEKAVNPPLLGVQDAIRGDLAVFAGGVTWVDAEYDERLGEVLRPMSVSKDGLQFGMEYGQDIRMQVAEAFYLSKLNLPPVGGPDMTAYEVGQRVQEFIRNALPLFEPMETEYNGPLCENTFELLLRNSPEVRNSIPDSIRGAEIQFQFESPLHDATEKIKLGQWMEAQQVLSTAIQLNPGARYIVDGNKSTRDVLKAVIPAEWLRTESDVDQMVAAEEQAIQAQQMLAQMQQGADVAKTLADAKLGQPQPAVTGMVP